MHLVSIIMPNFNGGVHLSSAIDSILAQSYPNIEFIIVDDASTDNSLSVIQSYNDKRISLIARQDNGGIVAALNDAIQVAKGDYLVRMDSDDISKSNRIEKLIECAYQNPNCTVISSQIEVFGTDSYISDFPENTAGIKTALLFGTPIAHPATMFKSTVFKSGLRYEDKYTHQEDYWLFSKLLKKEKFAMVHEALYAYRVHEQNITKINADSFKERSISIQKEIIKNHSGLEFNDNFYGVHFLVSKHRPIDNAIQLTDWLYYRKSLGSILNSSMFTAPVDFNAVNKKIESFFYRYADVSIRSCLALMLSTGDLNYRVLKYVLTRVVKG